MNTLDQINQAVATLNEEHAKFTTKGNSAAGTRARKAAQDIKVLAQKLRAEISESKNAAKA